MNIQLPLANMIISLGVEFGCASVPAPACCSSAPMKESLCMPSMPFILGICILSSALCAGTGVLKTAIAIQIKNNFVTDHPVCLQKNSDSEQADSPLSQEKKR